MRFFISKTSGGICSGECPCEEAEPSMELNWCDQPRWTIEIENLSELLDLGVKYGELILKQDSGPEIEIFDDYRS